MISTETKIIKNKKGSKKSASVIDFKNYNFYYGSNQVLFDIHLSIPQKQVVALIGPSGCGKSTLLRNINRMNDFVENAKHEGELLLGGESVYDLKLEVSSLRKRVGMVFQKSNVFPKSIFENVVFSLKMSGLKDKKKLEEIAEKSLRKAFLWNEIKDRLHESALNLSGGQMQRLCIARTIAGEPEILLMDEPCSALDPVATDKIEDLITKLKKDYTIVIVTHNLQQAARISDKTAFFYLGKLVEYSSTKSMFMKPKEKKTEDYIMGKFG